MKMITILDSRNKESTTLLFVAVAFVVVIIKFVLAGLSLGVLGVVPAMSGGEFAMAVGAVLGVWLTREWKEKDKAEHG